jgi:ubiquinone/menaquinone biosynthesis C-methylase UbiE
MKNKSTQDHDARIVDQFTKQAVPFAAAPAHADAIERLIELSGVGPRDEMLDVACGPGLVACAFARVARHVTGIDITEKMIEQARKLQREKGINNITFDLGSVMPLPYADNRFAAVVARYAMHHFLEPAAVLKEMVRVCAPGGRVVIADMSGRPEHMEAINRVEKLRDPSHARALSFEEWDEVFAASGLSDLKRSSYTLSFDLEEHLAASFPNPGDSDKIREIFNNDVSRNIMGCDARRERGRIIFDYVIAMRAGRK